jgi:hypothetical protein
MDVFGQHAQDSFGERTLSTARFPQDHHSPVMRQGEIDSIDCLDDPLPGTEVQGQISNIE